MQIKSRTMVVLALGLAALASFGCNGARWAGEAKEAVYQETRPLALINKYRAFKAMASQLDAKQAGILAGDASIKQYITDYGADRKQWPRDVREECAQKNSEVLDQKLSFNELAAQYNAAMADFATKFCNIGKMPDGFPSDCQEALKRSYAAYMVN